MTQLASATLVESRYGDSALTCDLPAERSGRESCHLHWSRRPYNPPAVDCQSRVGRSVRKSVGNRDRRSEGKITRSLYCLGGGLQL